MNTEKALDEMNEKIKLLEKEIESLRGTYPCKVIEGEKEYYYNKIWNAYNHEDKSLYNWLSSKPR